MDEHLQLSADSKDSGEVAKEIATDLENQLITLGVGKSQIDKQNLSQLRASLETINGIIDNPDKYLKLPPARTIGVSFSVLGIESTASRTIDDVRPNILPLLLERKRLIIDRISLLESEAKIDQIEKLISSLPEEATRENLSKQIQELKSELTSNVLVSRALDEEQLRTQIEQQLNAAEKRAKLEIELEQARTELKTRQGKARAQSFQSYLKRDTIATLIGAILLVVLTLVLILAAFTGHQMPEILNNSFLIILGYFFGQSVANRSVDRSEQDS